MRLSFCIDIFVTSTSGSIKGVEVTKKRIAERPTKMIHIRLTENVHRSLKVEVARQGTTVQELVARLIEKALK